MSSEACLSKVYCFVCWKILILIRKNSIYSIRRLKQMENEDHPIQNKDIIGTQYPSLSEFDASDERAINKVILDHTAAIIMVLDAEAKVRVFNRSAEVISGWKNEDIIGKTLWDTVLPPANYHSQKNKYVDFLSTSKVQSEMYQNEWIHSQTGEHIFIEWSNTVIPRANGNILISVGIDITRTLEIQQCLLQSKEQYRNLVENIHDGLIIDDSAGNIVFANDQFLKMFAIERADIGNINLKDTIDCEYWEEVRTRHELRIKGLDIESHFDYKGKRKDGTSLWVEAVVVALRNSEGIITGTQSTIRDISDKKNAEIESERYKQLLEKTGEIASVGSWEIDVNTKQFRTSQQVRKILGMLNDTEFGRKLNAENVSRYTLPEFTGFLLQLLEKSIADGLEWDEVFPLITSDKRKIIARVVCKTEKVEGKVTRVWGALQDITSMKQAELALKESEQTNRLILDSMPEAIIIIDENGRILQTNERIRDVFGYVPDEVVGKNLEILLPEQYRKSHAILSADFIKRKSERIKDINKEFASLHKNGSSFPSSITLTPIIFRGNDAVLATIRDVTDRKIWEKRMMQAQRMDSIGTLASGVAHDINNILTPILIGIPILRAEASSKRSHDLLKMIENNTKRGAELIKQVLSFARGIEGERTELDIRRIIDEIRTLVHETFPKTIRLQIKISQDIPLILGDMTQIHQVMLNLCVNARDAMPHGGMIFISADQVVISDTSIINQPNIKAGQYLLVKIQDQGVGIPPEIAERVFEPFFSTKEHGKGTGLGLSTVSTIVKSHNGFINLYSEVNKGSTFSIYLPALLSDANAESIKADKIISISGNDELILVVDDEANIRDTTRIVLETYGYKVITASDGAEAIAVYAQYINEIKLIVTDIMMPHMDGVSLIRVLKKMKPDIKVIAVSGLKHEAQLNEMGVKILTKPYASDALLFQIKELLAK